MSVQPAAPPADTSRVVALLAAGKTTMETADLTGWPRHRVVALINNKPGWLLDPKADKVTQFSRTSDDEPPQPTPLRRRDTIEDLLMDAADIDDKTVQREHAKTLDAIARLRVAVSTVSERIEAERALADAEQQLATARARLKELSARRRTGQPAAATTTSSEPTPQQVRAWAAGNGIDCPAKGKVPAHVREQYDAQNGA